MGSLGLAIIFATDKAVLVKLGLLTGNLGLAILSLTGAYKLRRRNKKR